MKLQYESLRKYCKDDFEYIVINNGQDITTRNIISEYCKDEKIEEVLSINITNNLERYYGMAQDHCICLNQIYKNIIPNNNSDINVIVDSDIFSFNNFSFESLLNKKDVSGIMFYLYGNTKYISSYIMIVNGNIDTSKFGIPTNVNADSGIWTTNWISKWNMKWLRTTCGIGFNEVNYIFKNSPAHLPKCENNYFFQIIEGCLLHYWQGTGWANSDKNYHDSKWEFIKFFIDNSKLYDLILDDTVMYDEAMADCNWKKDRYKLNLL